MDTLFSEALARIKELYTTGKREEARQAAIKFSNDNQNEFSAEAGKAYLNTLIEYASEWLNEEASKEAYIIRASANYSLKKYRIAIEEYTKAIELEPGYEFVYYNRGLAYYSLNQNLKAIADFDKSIELNPEYISAYYARGNIYSRLNEDGKAVEEYDKAIEIDPYFDSPYYARGNIYSILNQLELAISSFKRFIQLSNDKFWVEQARAKIVELEERIGDGDYDKVFDIIDGIKEVLMFKQGDITHYTGIGTAKALIINESKFRLSEATFLNDTSEGKQLNRYLDITRYKPEEGKELAAELYTQKPFIGSFVSSDQCDDLTLWRMYGKESNEEAKGCSLTISSEAFVNQIRATLEIDDEDAVLSLDNEFTFYRVAYIQEDNSILIPGAEEKEEELKSSLESLKQSLETYKGELPLKVREKLSEIAYLFKQAHYQYEREVRLVISGVGFDKRVDSTFEIPRVYIELGSVLSAVPKMTIGPKVERSEEWAAAFYYCFKEKDADCEISISRLPFK